MKTVLAKGALSYILLFSVHFLVNRFAIQPDQQLTLGWLAGLHALLFSVSTASVLLIHRFGAKSGSAANIFLLSSMVKFFVVVLFLVLMIKLAEIPNRVAIFHFMSAYFIGLFLQTLTFVKFLSKAD